MMRLCSSLLCQPHGGAHDADAYLQIPETGLSMPVCERRASFYEAAAKSGSPFTLLVWRPIHADS